MVSVVGQNGNVETVAEPVTDQVDIQDVNTRANANRLSQRLRSLKGHLTGKVKCCTQKIEQLRTMLDASQSTSQMMVEYARNMLNNFICCQTRQAEIEKGIVDLVQLRTEVWDVNDPRYEIFCLKLIREKKILRYQGGQGWFWGAYKGLRLVGRVPLQYPN